MKLSPAPSPLISGGTLAAASFFESLLIGTGGLLIGSADVYCVSIPFLVYAKALNKCGVEPLSLRQLKASGGDRTLDT